MNLVLQLLFTNAHITFICCMESSFSQPVYYKTPHLVKFVMEMCIMCITICMIWTNVLWMYIILYDMYHSFRVAYYCLCDMCHILFDVCVYSIYYVSPHLCHVCILLLCGSCLIWKTLTYILLCFTVCLLYSVTQAVQCALLNNENIEPYCLHFLNV